MIFHARNESHAQINALRCFRAFIALTVFALWGCSVAKVKPAEPFSSTPPVKMLMVQTPFAGDRKALQSVISEDEQKPSPEADAAILAAVENAQAQALSALRGALESGATYSVTDGAQIVGNMNNELAIGTPVTVGIAQQLRATSGADWLLRFHITDYGLTPTAWRKGVITFEVVSTLGIATIAYLKPATRAIAGIYLVQEAIEEAAEAYAGFWSLDEVCRPVRIEAELIELKTGDSVWRNGETGFSDVHLYRLVKHVRVEERNVQLQQALNQSATDIAAQIKVALAIKLHSKGL